MKVIHLCTSDNTGGAARAAYRLHKGLLQEGVQSKMFVRDKQTYDENVIKFKYPKGLYKANNKYRKYLIDNSFKKYFNTRPKGLEVFSDDRSSLRSSFMKQLPDADIYNLHWTSGFVDLPDFFSSINKPVVWTLHDMFPFTGGCHYNNSCDNYRTICHKCPQLGSNAENDLSRKIWERKSKIFSDYKNKIVIRADSHWLSEEAKKSSLFSRFDVGTIHYGIETDEFVPRNKVSCRQAFNIPQESKVIVFGAPGINNPRKGFIQLKEALRKVILKHSNIFLLSFGAGEIEDYSEISGLHLGHVSNNQLLSIIYNCADVFVIPSLQEAFGQTALEAMSCGVPVAGFNTGGIPDMIVEGITGYLAETGSIDGLCDAIKQILSLRPESYLSMAEHCREKVLSGFKISDQAEKYKELYSALIV